MQLLKASAVRLTSYWAPLTMLQAGRGSNSWLQGSLGPVNGAGVMRVIKQPCSLLQTLRSDAGPAGLQW